MYRYVGVRVYRYAGIQVCRCAGIHVGRYAGTPVYAGNMSRQAYRPTERPETEVTRQLFVNSQIPTFMKKRCSSSQVFISVQTDGQSRFNRRSARYVNAYEMRHSVHIMY